MSYQKEIQFLLFLKGQVFAYFSTLYNFLLCQSSALSKYACATLYFSDR